MATSGDISANVPIVVPELLSGAQVETSIPLAEVDLEGTTGQVGSIQETFSVVSVSLTGSVEHLASITSEIPSLSADITGYSDRNGQIAVLLPSLAVSIVAVLSGSCEEYILQHDDVFDSRGDIAVELILIEADLED